MTNNKRHDVSLLSYPIFFPNSGLPSIAALIPPKNICRNRRRNISEPCKIENFPGETLSAGFKMADNLLNLLR